MTRRTLTLSLVVVSSSLLTACMTGATPTAMAPAPQLTPLPGSEECSLPCWYGITPGVTTLDQALPLLEHRSLTASFAAKGPSIIQWADDLNSMYRGGEIYLDVDGGVQSIDLVLNGEEDELTVDELVQEYGNPDSVWTVLAATPVPDQCAGASLYYADLSAQFILSRFEHSVGVMAQQTVQSMRLLPLGTKGFSTDMFESPWEGYQDYSDRCK